MAALNRIVGVLFATLLRPFEALSPLVGLAVVALATALVVLVVFRLTSNQARIRQTKRLIQAGFYEIRLFNEDPRAILRAQWTIFRANFTYMRLSLVPLLWMLVPLVLLMAQLQSHYGHRGLAPDEAALVKVRLAGDWQQRVAGTGAAATGATARPPARLVAPDGVRVETGDVWMPAIREVAWRVRADAAGDYELGIQIAGQTYTKTLSVSDRPRPQSTVRPSGLIGQILYPAEPPLPRNDPIASITVTCPVRQLAILGWQTHWLVIYCILTLVFAVALKGRLGVAV